MARSLREVAELSPSIFWQLHKMAFLLEKRVDESLHEQLDIRFAQYKVMEAISRNENSRQNTIADLLDQTEASISRQIRLLDKKKLVHVDSVMGNKRARELRLTDQGENQLRLCREIVNTLQLRVFGGLGDDEQHYLKAMLDHLLQSVRS